MSAPAIIVGGTNSGVGKTSVTLGIVAALRKRGLIVQPFKVGPDFLDPLYLSIASGQTCHNLDGWMCGLDYARHLIDTVAANADVIVIEGVMGLFDGAGPDTLNGSTAEIAKAFDLPVLLIGDAGGTARSFAATVHGFTSFEDGVQIAGAVANRVGSERHGHLLDECLKAANQPPLIGAIPKGAFPTLNSRHLGLVSATRKNFTDEVCGQLAAACENHLNLDRLLTLARPIAAEPKPPVANNETERPRVRLAVAKDDAFHFVYPDNLAALERAGAQLVFFSPLVDTALPDAIDGLYVPGGYPELFAKELSGNQSVRAAVRRFADGGGVIYAECGGLMYLGERLGTTEDAWPMCGVLPVSTQMLDKRKVLGYTEVVLNADCHFGSTGTHVRGHEFHYSEIIDEELAASGWQRIYDVRRRRGGDVPPEGFRKGNVLASYVHLHWASSPGRAEAFVDFCWKGSERFRMKEND